jgi:hypothetical protein
MHAFDDGILGYNQPCAAGQSADLGNIVPQPIGARRSRKRREILQDEIELIHRG